MDDTYRPIIDESEDLLSRTLQSQGIYKRNQIDHYNKFIRFGPAIDPYNVITTTREYVFFTKPDLHIFSNGSTSILNPEIANVPIFVDALTRYNDVLKSLQWSSSRTPFVNLLSNQRTSSLDLPGISVDDVETSANLYGTKIFYRKASDQSDEAYEFSLEFEDTKYLEVYMWLKLFDEYERKKFNGKITPPSTSYIFNKILHDQMSVYKFIVGDDGETIIHYSKLYGVYPKNVPRDSFSELPQSGGLKFTVHFKCTFVEDMEPNILIDFNKLTNNLGGDTLYMYDPEIAGVPGEWVTAPYIVAEKTALSKAKLFKLRWRK